MSDERLLHDVADGIAAVTLNRPEKRNALDAATVEALRQAFARAEADPDVRVVLLRGAGNDFCAGADLAHMERLAATGDPLENLADAAALGDLFIEMRRLEKPIIAAVHGHAFAGGAGLATACDMVLAGAGAQLGYPEIQRGFVPAMVMALLRRLAGERAALDLVLTGRVLGAEEARALGLVNRVFADATFEQDALEYARELAARPPAALRLIKRLLYGIDGASFEEGIHRGAEVNVLARATDEAREGVRRFLERRSKR